METLNFMDPKQRRRQYVTLMIGYALVGCAIILMTTILVFVAYGFGFQNGQVIQNGLVFVSSTPQSAQIYINNKLYKDQTNTRVVLPSGVYNFALKRTGYRTWQRSISVTGGLVESFVYPFLFPTSLTATTRQTYATTPSLVTQSLDRRWLLVARPRSFSSFDMYDLNNPSQAPVIVNLPDGLLTDATSSQSLQTVAWAGDNTHLLLEHQYDGKTEYILVNRTNPDQSINLTRNLSLSTTASDVRLNDEKYNQYVILDTTAHTLTRATLGTAQTTPYASSVSSVLAYTTYGTNTLLYVTPDTTDKAKVDVDLYDGTNTYLIRRAAANTTYLLNLSTYSGALYVAVSAASENEAYVYEDPASQIANPHVGVAIPAEVFSIIDPNYLQTSTNGQYIAFEHGTQFAVYDADNQESFSYTVPGALDTPQTHATWMDAARLMYVSKGQLVVFDYDGQNRQTLVSTDAAYIPSFDPNYKNMYTFMPSAANKANELLMATPLRTSADR